MKNSTLLIFAHGAPDSSRINRQLLAKADAVPDLHIHDISSAYPDFQIALEDEIELLQQHHNIVLQFPLYWYSLPAILKAWLDVVCAAPAVLQKNGILSGKKIKVIATAGSDLGAMSTPLAEVEQSIFWPLEQTARYLKMEWQQPKMLNQVSRWDNYA